MKLESMEIEQHPLEPFLPGNARLLMLGSFPPQKKRWSMEFYYPNWNNDMWRITGFLFFNDKDYFVDKTKKAFCKERLISFLQEKGIALFDTASAIRRLQDNASDKFLEVVQPTDVPALLHRIPQCKAIVTTGEKATDTLCTQFSIDKPKVGDFTEFSFRKPSDAPLPDAFFLKSLPAGTGKKSSSVSHYVSGLTDVVSNFLYKISTSVTCIFESLHYLCSHKHGSSSVGRAPVSKTGCREFEPLLPC